MSDAGEGKGPRHLHLVRNDSLAGEARAGVDPRHPSQFEDDDEGGPGDIARRHHPAVEPDPISSERSELLSALSSSAAALHRHFAVEAASRDPWFPEDYASARRLVRDIIQVDLAVLKATLQSRALETSFGWVARQQMLTDSSTSLESLLSHLSSRSAQDPWEPADYETALAVLTGMRRVLDRLEDLCRRRLEGADEA